MCNRAVVVTSGLQGYPTATAKAKQKVRQALHVCSAVGHAEAMSLTRRGLDKDRVPVAGYVYCNPVQCGDGMVRVSHWVVSFGSQRSKGCLLPAVADNHYAFTTAQSSPAASFWLGRMPTVCATS